MPIPVRQTSEENLTKVDILRRTMLGLLQGQGMSIREVIDYLMSEPYSVNPQDLNLIAIALNQLQDRHLIEVVFNPDPKTLDMKLVFRSRPLRHEACS